MVFFNLAEVAALPKVVDKGQLPQAIAQNQAGHSGAPPSPARHWAPGCCRSAGRVAAGRCPSCVDALGHLASAWCVWKLRTPLGRGAGGPGGRPAQPAQAEMAVGLRWLWQQPLVRRIAGLTCLSNFVMAAVPLLVIVLAKAQGASEAQIGLAFSAQRRRWPGWARWPAAGSPGASASAR